MRYAMRMQSPVERSRTQAWHALSLAEVSAKLKVRPEVGLSEAEAEKRLKSYGPNRLAAENRSSAFGVFLRQFKNRFILILVAAIGLSILLGHAVEAVTIAVIVAFAIILGFIQEWRTERVLEKLQMLVTPFTCVIRGGVEREIATTEIVPGDILLLVTGDRVPADARLVQVSNLKADEAVLTGESMAVEKQANRIISKEAIIADRQNMVFAGTHVTYGRGRALVVATAMQTAFGQITGLLGSIERETTPLQKDLDRVGSLLTKCALGIVSILALIGVFRGQPIGEVLLFSVALAVATVPEALPAVVTIALSMGVQRMAKRHALIRSLPAAETLGCTTYICSDKTGTLTKDEMTVRKIVLGDGTMLSVTGTGYDPKGSFFKDDESYPPSEPLKLLLRAAALSSDAQLIAIDGTWGLKGDPTEAALVVAAAKAGLQKETLDEQYKRIAEIPFSSEARRMTTLHETPEGMVVYEKGAAELILQSCTRVQTKRGVVSLAEAARAKILALMQDCTKEALRVIGVAFVPATDLRGARQDMIFLGFFGMIDPPRPEARAAIQKCREAGIHLLMMTGDHENTAEAVARELGLLLPGGRVVTGAELSTMSQKGLERQVEAISVCARVSPEHKLRIIEALQKRGHVVAMTGDGINDAPALKKADIGIAMGITGTDVTKEVAAMTLADDNFASIVAAVEEGRTIFVNIKKFLLYLLSSNLGEIGLIVAASVAGLPLPLSAIQILYINLASDGLPALALAVDSGGAEIMRHPPRGLGEGLFNFSSRVLMVIGGLWITLAQMGLYVWALHSDRSTTTVMTMVFASLVLMQLMSTYNFRSYDRSLLQHPFGNYWLNRAVIWESLLLLLVIYLPFFQGPLGTTMLSFADWGMVIVVALTVIPVLELTKRLLSKNSIIR